MIYYQAGVAVISGSVFKDASDATGGGVLSDTTIGTIQLGNINEQKAGLTGNTFITGSSISGSADAFRNRIYNVSFNNTTELNSTVYFCRAGHNEFNYSSNPTYISTDAATKSQIRVKNNSLDQPVSYITTIGLYSADNELLIRSKSF